MLDTEWARADASLGSSRMMPAEADGVPAIFLHGVTDRRPVRKGMAHISSTGTETFVSSLEVRRLQESVEGLAPDACRNLQRLGDDYVEVVGGHRTREGAQLRISCLS
jgi:hypothetical protein